ncbi:GAF domain-containing sensor histidine kinase [Sulfuritalea hydrogenivorans]|uniref:histidine kinase n=1 Tax=Sulfuritalea hydrogenivorans sk43H TaxID=1223802 RepID=W0SE27_9PROT|nr:ATP-binding protein [Sulfuritalea hydrogenivorans]MDK9713195.1 histidine kinase [Sulfuritalea sp.]BAO29192.1 GAF sensor signal transduction histidine kinase [Sulfuritalea hydrogenivorans sk43H]
MNGPDDSTPQEHLDLDPSGSYTLEALHVLGEISSNLADEDDLDELLGRFLGTMIRLAKADAGVVRVLTSDGQHLRMVASRGLPPAVVEKERLVSRDCGQCGIAIGQNRPLFEIDLKGCAERTGGDFFKSGCQAMVVVPLSNAGRLLGTYNLFLPEAFELPEEVALLFRSIGEHLGMALENARLKRENLRIVLTSERQMMAAEIHDSLAQTLAYMKMRMAMLNDAIAEQSLERTAKYAGDVGQALDDAYGHLRELLVQFRSRMDPMGLQHALQGLACGFQERTGIALRYENKLTDLRLAPEAESQVFHILQEALANVARHSGATEASMTLEAAGDYYNATIEDNGRGGQGFLAIANRVGGFEEHPGLRDHFGLAIMRERAEKIGGHLEVANLVQGGFRVRLSFPPGGGVSG